MPVSRSRKINIIQMVFLSALIVLTALIVKPLVRMTERRMDTLKNELVSSLENIIDYRISYSSISPSIFSFISIKDLVIYKNNSDGDVLAEIKSFKAFYSPFYFFSRDRTETPLQAVKRFNIENVSINFDEEEDGKLLAFFRSDQPATPGIGSSVALLPLRTRLSGKKIDVNLQTSLGTFRASELFVSLVPEKENYRTRIDGQLELIFSGTGMPVRNVQAGISARGSISPYFEALNFNIGTEDFTTELFDMTDQKFQFLYTQEGLELRKIQDNSPFDLALRYDSEIKDLIFTFNAEKFRPGSIIFLKGDLADFNHYAGSEITGSGSFLLGDGNSDILYSLKADLALNRDIFDRPVFIRSDLTGDAERINIRNLDLRTREGRVLFTGDIDTDTFFPTGTLRLVDIQTPNGFAVNSRVKVGHDSGFIHMSSDRVDLGKEEIENLDIVIYPDPEYITASLQGELSGEEGRTGKISVDSMIALSGHTDLTSFISFSDLPVESLLPLMPVKVDFASLPDELGGASVTSELIFKTDLQNFDVQVGNFSLISGTNSENKLTFSASYDGEGFKLNDLYLNWNDYDLNGYINSSIQKDEYRISTHFDFEDKPYRFQALYRDGYFSLEGDYGLYGFVQKNEKGDYAFRVNSRSFPLPVLENTFFADLNASGYFGKGDWSLFLDDTRISTDRYLTLKNPELQVTAQIDRAGGDIYDLRYRDEKSSLKGLGRISYSTGDINTWISLLDESGKTDEQYDMYFAKTGEFIESRVSVVSSPLERLRETGLTGNISLDLLFSGTQENPDYQAVVQTERMNLDGVPVEISSFVRGDRERIRISDMELDYGGLMLNRGLVMVELAKGKLLATGAVNQIINKSKASTSLSALVTSEESFDIFSLSSLRDGNLDGKLTVAPIMWDGMKTFPSLDVELKKRGALLTAEIDRGNILASSFNLDDGSMALNVNDLFPFRLRAEGKIENSVVDAEIRDLVFYPSFINYFMPTDPYRDKRHVIFTSGDISGSFRLSGPLSDPDYDGTLYVNDVYVESPYLAEKPGPVSTVARLDGHNMILDPFSIDLNRGVIDVESSFEFHEAVPKSYNVDVEIKGTQGARIAYSIPGFSWDGHFTGFTHIEGSSEGGFLKGTLICNDLESSLDSDAERPSVRRIPRNPSVNGFTVDLTIQTGRDVNFYLPNSQVPIIQATAEKDDHFNIAYDSRSDVLALVGRVDIRTGEINYFNKTFYLQEGYIEFNESQAKFNPKLNVRADVVSRDELGDEVTISLLFDDYLMNEFKPEFLSFPRKTENEILALLGQSFIPSNDPDQVSVASLIVATGGMIGKSTIMQPFEEAIKSSLDLDFVSFNTNIIENAILDRFQDQNLYDQDRQMMNFARYLKDTSLFVGEYIGDYLFLEGSLVVDYDESHSVSSVTGGLELNVNLNLQFITPFVLIDWTYNPKSNPGSDYFFPQNTISFTWQYSY